MFAPLWAWCLLASLAAIGGCQTRQPGVKSAFGSQYAIVASTVADTTEAAAAVLEEMGLEEVTATATDVDGEITGFTRERTRVEVYAAQEDPTRTEVSVMVGAMGEAAVGTEIIARIREKLGR
ncbi:hypothetical protein PSMK_10590 [Phycisphaera mikurensis NBRC 102666]|uniref:DUF3568 family protein n=1 Tax=Phycisphaera mikurensis (strain NBRC 102666 / KCTC 22515 / FYK2301M01) TaxID=1142394 RepID=I0ID80_PHYMF|nr:hypothetical protein PSMK_10590 [Phycisphaera mikurensis NBRC 102666]